MLQTLHSETNFLNKLILHRKEIFLSLTKASKIFVLNSVTLQKNQPAIFCSNFFFTLYGGQLTFSTSC